MSTTLTRPAPALRVREAGEWRAVPALARFEARELALQIPVFVFLTGYVAYRAWMLVSRGYTYPALQDVDRSTQFGPELVGLALLVCVNRATLRSHRHGTDAHFDVLPLAPWRRTLAHALSVVPYALVVAVVVTVQFTWAALQPGAVGHGSPAELATGPLSVLLLGVTGTLLARMFRTTLATVLFVAGGYVAFALALTQAGDAHWLTWLMPSVTDSGADPVPSALVGRPAAWHALYLAGLTVLLACLAVLLGGGRTRAVKAVTGLALAATAAGVAGQSPGDPAALTAARRAATVAPQHQQTCVPHGTSTYCAFPEWSGRTADWAAVVADVQRYAGGTAAHARLTVRQRIDATAGLTSDSALSPATTPGQVTVGTNWGGTRVHEFAAGVATVLVTGDEAAGGGQLCDARTVTITWLALAAQEHPLAAFRDVRLDDSVRGSGVVLTPTNPYVLDARQTDVVRESLSRPRDEVAAAVRAHWSELTSARTPLARVAEVLGVKAPKGGGDSCGE
ncbi:ABC transporter permease [Streptomyces sp. 7R007]